jgi:periplasmic copper chaperone A
MAIIDSGSFRAVPDLLDSQQEISSFLTRHSRKRKDQGKARGIVLVLAFLALIQSIAAAGEPPVKVEQGWVRAMPPSSEDSAAYMTLTNNGDEPLRLTGAKTPIAGMVMPMVTTREIIDGKEVMGMKGVDALVIAPHGQLVLGPEGDHLMLMELISHLKAGERVKLTLHFEPGNKELMIELPVALRKP